MLQDMLKAEEAARRAKLPHVVVKTNPAGDPFVTSVYDSNGKEIGWIQKLRLRYCPGVFVTIDINGKLSEGQHLNPNKDVECRYWALKTKPPEEPGTLRVVVDDWGEIPVLVVDCIADVEIVDG